MHVPAVWSGQAHRAQSPSSKALSRVWDRSGVRSSGGLCLHVTQLPGWELGSLGHPMWAATLQQWTQCLRVPCREAVDLRDFTAAGAEP